ncbi:hypothetical protein [Bradyrhizobium sp. OAE829]|uniref:hypothetical protein n=1 Tax=Bradyrhizobium sp. OAE829 TaxID=2663807 RepID=UPI00178AC31C
MDSLTKKARPDRSLIKQPEKKVKAAECAREARKQAALLAPGTLRDALLVKVKQYEAEVAEASERH